MNIKEIGLWTGVTLLLAMAFTVAFVPSMSLPVKAIVWVIAIIVALLLSYFTVQGQKVSAFAHEAYLELLKVVWPTRQETIQTTAIVMIMVTVTGFVLWGIDSLMIWVIAKITHLG